jgi:hypothetical protein
MMPSEQSVVRFLSSNRLKYENQFMTRAEKFGARVAMTQETSAFSADDFLKSIGVRIDGFMYRGQNRDRTGFASLILKEDLPKVDAAVADALSRGGNWQVSYRIQHRDE